MKQLFWIFLIIAVIGILYFSGMGLQTNAIIMTLILHPWVLLPVVIPAVIIVLLWNALKNKDPEE
ncbi:MAG: hypothetical protein HZA35_02225 [Parcubacteria group bacterium]|nr:hypothetical protein [Parcubacteria group bacterium]